MTSDGVLGGRPQSALYRNRCLGEALQSFPGLFVRSEITSDPDILVLRSFDRQEKFLIRPACERAPLSSDSFLTTITEVNGKSLKNKSNLAVLRSNSLIIVLIDY
jgi:hypothetical protein